MAKTNSYAEDGVDVGKEAIFSKMAYKVALSSYEYSPFVEVKDLSNGNFRGPRPFVFKNLPNNFLVESSSDGLGTKSIIIDAAKAHKTAGYDLLAMVASDITRYGGIPLVLTNVLDLFSVGDPESEEARLYSELLTGLGEASRANKSVLLKGETAQMGNAVGSDIPDSKTKFNWSASMFGVYTREKILTGEKIKEGDAIIALKENGFRANGFSAVRSAFKKKFGEFWHKNEDASKYVSDAATPSVLYDYFVNTLHGWYDTNFEAEINLHAVVHISGGGIPEKLGNDLLFPLGFSAKLENLFTPPEIMTQCAKWHGMDEEEMYKAWNGGQGMLLILPKEEAAYCIKRAKEFEIDAQVAGEVTNYETQKINIKYLNRNLDFRKN